MHELAITESVVMSVSERFGDARVLRVLLQIGKLSGVVPDAVRFCFDVCARGTTLEGATLEIDEIPALARCHDCGAAVELESFFGLCRCGSVSLEMLSGQELKVREVEVA
jgi:hydrogenase nickel incorporation protein HypA/HybF